MIEQKNIAYRSPKPIRLTIACFYLKSYFPVDDQGVIMRARDMLREHNIDLGVWPENGRKTYANTLDYGDNPIADTNIAYQNLGRDVEKKLGKVHCPFVFPLPIIFCQITPSAYGITPYAVKRLTKACLVSPSVNVDKVTLLHEMGHASGLGHEEGEEHRGNFMHEADPRSFMYQHQVETMAKSWYAVG